MSVRIAGLALAGAVLTGPVAAMAGVVVKSTGPSSSKYPVGAKVADSATITLKAGDSVTVLTSRGTKVMKGAGTFKVGERPKVTRSRFSALTRTRAANRVRLGSVRGGNDENIVPTNPSLWYVDVTKPGTICLNSMDTVRFWRPDSASIATYSLTAPDGVSADITFDAEDSVAPLDPAVMSVSAGGTYSISAPGSEAANVQITFAFIDGEYRRADQMAEALIAAGCTTQVDQMADRLSE
ncbi:hypothetical protein [Erythrobacter sp. F6033]|uniref:hypothetical protein n=1 Tax=Erythrobacter sp. F6033 TaxID=2926401 RepID=UPI001FF146F7|nr:hypothetical protein [Erythrobacter sp. F6033]MCK0127655.1 hypothetical protein [Erythrobacter sp. F6033]